MWLNFCLCVWSTNCTVFLGSIKLDNCYIIMIRAPLFEVNKAELDRNSLMIGCIVTIIHTHHTLIIWTLWYSEVMVTIQCTMPLPMSIEILEILKRKNSLHAHFMLKSIHSFFIWCKTTKILTLYQNFKKIAHIWGVIVEKLKGGSRKAEILVVFKLQYL